MNAGKRKFVTILSLCKHHLGICETTFFKGITDHHDIDYREKQTTFGYLTSIYSVATCPESRPIVNQILYVVS